MFGVLLRRTREAKGMSQGSLARLIPCSRPQITRIEAGKRVPQKPFVVACDEILGTGGELLEIWEEIDWYAQVEHPDWFQRYARLEAEAVAIHEFHVSRISGLLQTERYARALLAQGDPELIEERVAARLSRQVRLTAEDPPLLEVIMSEACIRQMVGGPEVMHEQLQRLLTMGQRPNIVIQVAPFSLGEQVPFGTYMALVTSPDGRRHLYSESLWNGQFIEDPKEVQRYQRTYDLLRADALSARESAHLIRSVMKGLLNMGTPTPDLSAAPWRKSTYSDVNGGSCIEIADGFPNLTPVRDSKDPHGPALLFPADTWRAFVAGVRAGEFPSDC